MDGSLSAEDLERELTRYKRYVDDYLTATEQHRQRARANYDYRHGQQWSEKNKAIFAERGQPCLTFNMIGGKVGSMLGAEIVGRTDPKAVGRNPGNDTQAADVATAILMYICDKAKWPSERSLCRESYYVQGVMGVEVCADEREVDGQNRKLSTKHIPYERLFWDPHSFYADYRDAKYMGYVFWQDADDTKEDWADVPGAEDIIDACESSAENISSTDEELDDKPGHWVSGGSDRKRIRVSTIWCKKKGEWWTATYCAAGFLEEPRPSPYVSPDGTRQCGMLLQACYTRNENERYGIVEDLMSPQEEVNWRRSKALDLMHRKTVIADEGAVENVESARREIHAASGWISKRRGYELTLVDHQQQIVDNLQLLQDAKGAFEVIGPSESLMGSAAPSASGKSIEVRQRSALLKYGDVLDGARQWELRVYEQLWYRATQYWTEKDYVRVSDDPQSPQWLGINVPKPVTFAEMAMRRGASMDDLKAMVQSGRASVEQLTAVATVEYENKLAELDVDIILQTGPDASTQREQQTENFMSLLGQVGPQLPPKTLQTALEIVVELSPIDNKLKKRFLESMRPSEQEQQQQAQQQAQAQQVQEQAVKLQLEKASAEVHSEHAKADKDEAAADKLMAEAATVARNIGVPPPAPKAATAR